VFRRKAAAAESPLVEALGEVRSASGDLLLLDFGLLRLWSAERPPLLEDGVAEVEVVEHANAAGDYRIVGRDAASVAGLIDLASVKGCYAFDLPDSTHLVDAVAKVCAGAGLRAEVVRIARMPHLERLHRLLADSPNGAEIPFHGMWGVALRGVPAYGALPVLGRRMDPAGPDAGRWRSVWVECGQATPVDAVEAGYVLVEEARLLFADPQVLGRWRANDPAVGLADVVFWGRDETAVAEQTGASTVDDGGDTPIYGWVDRPLVEAVELLQRLEALRSDGLRFATDLRPHDDHHRILGQARRTDKGSGVIDVAGQPVTGLFTSWGDGAFPVFCDLAADGSLVRVRVELGAPEIVSRTRRFEEMWFGELAKRALVSTRVTREGAAIGWLYREAPNRDDDSGWRILAGDESDEYTDNPSNIVALPLRDVIRHHPDIEPLLTSPAPTAFTRDNFGTFHREDPQPSGR